MIKVLLKQHVAGLGHKGDIVEIKSGYARNYLIPHRLAVRAMQPDIKRYQAEQSHKKEEMEAQDMRTEEIKERLSKKRISLYRKGTSPGTLYAAITQREIADAIYETYGVKVLEVSIQCETIKTVGLHPFKIAFKNNKGAVSMKVKVLPLNHST